MYFVLVDMHNVLYMFASEFAVIIVSINIMIIIITIGYRWRDFELSCPLTVRTFVLTVD